MNGEHPNTREAPSTETDLEARCLDCGQFKCECFADEDELECTWCGGDGMQENDDPLWHGFDKAEIPCECCAGTGLRKHQTIF